jgi:hypothetical protein
MVMTSPLHPTAEYAATHNPADLTDLEVREAVVSDRASVQELKKIMLALVKKVCPTEEAEADFWNDFLGRLTPPATGRANGVTGEP